MHSIYDVPAVFTGWPETVLSISTFHPMLYDCFQNPFPNELFHKTEDFLIVLFR